MNKRSLWPLILAGLALSACADTNQLYNPTDYLNGSFVERRYDVWEGSTKNAYQAGPTYSKTLEQLPLVVDKTAKGYFSGSGKTGQENLASCYGYQQAVDYHRTWFLNSKGELLKWGNKDGSDIVHGPIGGWADNSPLYDVVYSQTKRLDLRYSGFSRGFVSKFYNGQIKCNGWSYYAMAILSPEGYGTMFPYELDTAEYFEMAVLMGTDNQTSARVTTSDLIVTFYKYSSNASSLASYQVRLKEVNLSCNNSSANTSLVGFTFADAGIEPRGIVGMSLTWENLYDPTGASSDFSSDGYHDGICLYEVLFPDSTWN